MFWSNQHFHNIKYYHNIITILVDAISMKLNHGSIFYYRLFTRMYPVEFEGTQENDDSGTMNATYPQVELC